MLRRPFGNSGLEVPALGFEDAAHDEYRRRFAIMRAALGLIPPDWDEFALRFAAFAPGADCVVVGGTDVAKLERNVAAVQRVPLNSGETAAVAMAFERHGQSWRGLV